MSVAETVCPSVRGAEGIQVTVLLALSGTVTGGAVGFAAGVAWAVAGLGTLGPVAVAVLVLACAVGDAAARWTMSRPLAIGRQVPQVWGQLFGARLVATLYGARLGVGPLTILRSWTWWGAFVVGASLGPWLSAAVGVGFALTRTVVTVVAGGGLATGTAMQHRMARLLRIEPAVAWATIVAVAGLALFR